MHKELQQNFSIIIPTFKEATTIGELIQRIAAVKFNVDEFEVILVDDDSKDGMVNVVNDLSVLYPWLKLIVRHGKKSLSASVIDGINDAIHPLIIVMDADLSHPPEVIPQMLRALENPDIDFVIGSRYVAGGSTDAVWPILRKVLSKIATLLAKLIISSNIKDPLSGFIGIRKQQILNASRLTPIGWKISLELIVKCNCKRILEIPIHFTERHKGKSKMNVKVILHYLLHVNRLAFYKIFGS